MSSYRALFLRATLLGTCLVLSASALRAEPSQHWAYQPVVRPALPTTKDATWARNPIDAFILARLEQLAMRPSPEAPRHAWLRRVTFDLTGLPPTPDELAAFERDHSPDAYQRVVDRLLNSPRYGERMATHWLDLARYADTHGYYVDSHRDMWRYRDEVIDAFNRHQPFDQFTIEQLAGDLLPDATLSQKVASGFNRNHMINFEQGAIPEEYLNEYVVDRVVTTATVWMGQTMQCAQCHDHKHDPFTTRDFYSLYAFFNNVPDEGLDGRRGNAVPVLKSPTRAQQQELAQLARAEAQIVAALDQRSRAAASDQMAWETRLRAGDAKLPEPPRDVSTHFPLDEEDGETTKMLAAKEGSAKIEGSAVWVPGKFQGALLFDGDTTINAGDIAGFQATDAFSLAAWIFATTKDSMTLVSRQQQDETERGYAWSLTDGKLQLTLRHQSPEDVLEVRTTATLPTSRWRHVAATYDGTGEASGIRLYINGEPQEVEVVRDRLAGSTIASEQSLVIGQSFRGMLDDLRIYARVLSSSELSLLADSNPVLELVAIPAVKRLPAQAAQLRQFFLEHHDDQYQRLLQQRAALVQTRRAIEQASPTSMVMGEQTPAREAFVLDRGSYELPGERVTPGTPAVLPPLPADAPRNRLALARWLVDGRHPLTSRVTVNRLWQLHFGQGLVLTSEDFGTNGAPPTHPELLDWLADEFVRSGWNVQHLQRLIVTSAAYRQAAVQSAELAIQDPDNRWLARFPRERLPAEMLRDQALAASGLLVETMYGPGVFPYHPPGLWEEIGYAGTEFSAQSYTQSHGADLYRRSVYSFWKRTSPPPNMVIFDAPDRETCTTQRSITNTPLQALVLWNDPIYVESARALASQIIYLPGLSDEERIQALFSRILSHRADARELTILSRLLAGHRKRYGEDPAAAKQLLSVGESVPAASFSPGELAAWTLLAHTVLNCDESLHRN